MKIFLKEVFYWEYEGETDNKLTSTRYKFTPEGEFGIENKNNITREVIRRYAQNKIDVSVLWEDYPEFGKYDDIINIEREIPQTLIKYKVYLSDSNNIQAFNKTVENRKWQG